MSESSDPVEIAVAEPRAILALVGEDLFASVLQCLVHADRLASLLDFVLLSVERHGEDSVSHQRNLRTIFAFACGTLWEVVGAIERLDATRTSAGFAANPQMDELNRIAQQLREDPAIVRARNSIGFHVDSTHKLVKRGLLRLVEKAERLHLYARDSTPLAFGAFPLADDSLLAGFEADEKELARIIRVIGDGHKRLAGLVEAILVSILERSGVGVRPAVDEGIRKQDATG